MFGPLLPEYQRLAGRRGIPPDVPRGASRRAPPVAAAMLLHAGEADAAICGGTGELVAAGAVHPADHPAPAGRQSRVYALSAA